MDAAAPILLPIEDGIGGPDKNGAILDGGGGALFPPLSEGDNQLELIFAELVPDVCQFVLVLPELAGDDNQFEVVLPVLADDDCQLELVLSDDCQLEVGGGAEVCQLGCGCEVCLDEVDACLVS